MTIRKWRVKTFNGRTWENYRYYTEDLPAFKDFMLRQHQSSKYEAFQMNVKLDSNRAYMNPGGNDNLLWIQGGKASRPLGESREYWENILQQAKDYVKSIKSDSLRSCDESCEHCNPETDTCEKHGCTIEPYMMCVESRIKHKERIK